MNSNITEEASKLRANAASSVVNIRFNLGDFTRQFDTFKIESTSTASLNEKEFRIIVDLRNMISKLMEQVKFSISISCSAVSASTFPANAANIINSLMDELANADNNLIEADNKLSEFNASGTFHTQKDIIESVQNYITTASQAIRKTVEQLYLLIFG